MYFYYKSNLRIVKRGKTNFAIFAIFYRERLKPYFFPVLDSFRPLLFFPTFVAFPRRWRGKATIYPYAGCKSQEKRTCAV